MRNDCVFIESVHVALAIRRREGRSRPRGRLSCTGYGPPPRQPWRAILVLFWTVRGWLRDWLRR